MKIWDILNFFITSKIFISIKAINVTVVVTKASFLTLFFDIYFNNVFFIISIILYLSYIVELFFSFFKLNTVDVSCWYRTLALVSTFIFLITWEN